MVTAELRWFYRGKAPAAIAHWLQHNCPGEALGAPEAREDVYLYTPGCDYLNIKFRNGELEIKWRQAESGAVRFASSWEGNVEKWTKCICKDLQAQVSGDALETGTWVSVKKQRSQRHYQILASESLTAFPVKERKERGCSVELTQLNIRDNNWWSFALEAFGEDTDLMDNLHATASLLMPAYQGPQLQAHNSYGYPKWLTANSE